MILINKKGKKKCWKEWSQKHFFFNDCQTVNQRSELTIIIHDSFLFYDICLKFSQLDDLYGYILLML